MKRRASETADKKEVFWCARKPLIISTCGIYHIHISGKTKLSLTIIDKMLIILISAVCFMLFCLSDRCEKISGRPTD